MSTPASVRIKRIYEDASPSDGARVLVDRLWPRGVSKQRAALDDWLKDVAPSPDLRTWWDHDADRMVEFAQRYRHELETSEQAADAVVSLRNMTKRAGGVTLLYGAKDPHVNHATILADYLRS